ncbi:MAG: hypothetical protein IT360_22575 [Gemmatimonadaceae bacterium]|nr:hypothetical protein [Gemmatimonadaceae bacterium]
MPTTALMTAETGCTLRRRPYTVSAPDAAFVSRKRCPEPSSAGFAEPARHEGRVHRADGSVTLLSAEDSLDGEAVLPGFSSPLAAITRGG